jgi:maltose O-acetyltransferase
MAIKSLNRLGGLREAIMRLRGVWIWLVLGIVIDPSIKLSLSGRLRSRRRGSIRIGKETMIAFKTLICTIDERTGEDRPITIGERCFIGGGSHILPGVTIGDGSIVGGGAVVYESVPPGCIVGGNPARVLRRDIEVVRHGRLLAATETTIGWTEL